MAENSPITFVRTRPRKISITETYYYKVEVQDFINFQFDKADGEIKLEFLYDGAVQDFRWKLRRLLSTLLDKIELLKQVKDIIQRFLDVGIIRWLAKWLGLALIWRTLIRIILGSEQDEKYFGVDAIADVTMFGSDSRTVQVGHLILYDEGQPNLATSGSAYETLAIELSVNDLPQKLAQNQRCVLTHKYKPPQPIHPPLYLHKIELTDVEINPSTRLHPIYDEILNLKIYFEMDVSRPSVDEKDKANYEVVKQWWQEMQTEIDKNEEVDKKTEFQILDQVWYINTVDRLDNILQKLALDRGGYILIDEDKIQAEDGKVVDDKLQRLKECLLKAAFRGGKIFVPVFLPYSYSVEHKNIFVIPVPAVPPRWYENRPGMNRSRTNNRLWVRSDEAKTPVKDISLDGEITSTTKELAEIIAGLANTQGGCFQVKASGNSKQRPYDIVVSRINRARQQYLPLLDYKLIKIFYPGEESQLVTVEITQPSQEVHSVEGIIPKWEDDQINRLTPDKDIDEIYKLIRDHCRPSYPVIEPLPAIEYACLKGPQFDTREQNGAHYDPRQKTLKWTEKLPFIYNSNEQVYQKMLQVGFNRPVELYDHNQLSGEMHISWSQKVLSGLGFVYFDALGVEIPEKKLNIERKSNIKLVFEHIMLLDVFRRRGFSASRELHFEGVKLEQNRLQDIQGMLADLGLENITKNTNKRANIYSLESIPIDEVLKNYDGYRITGERPDGLSIELAIRGELTNLHRERREGERTERMRIKSGSMHIVIWGSVLGDLQQAQQLSTLLNHLQRLLKERFNHVRVQVA